MARRPRRGRPSAATSDAAASASSATPAAGRPLRLVYRDSDGKLVMDPEAVAALQLVKGPVGVVSVCGRAREGKSFLLNQLLGESSCFQVTSTDKLCTKGLWIWILPMKMIAVDGTEYNLVLLDTEGIDAYDQTDSAIQIFSIAVPLSSMFIYNKMGGIDEASIDRLSQVTEMTLNLVTASKRQDLSPVFVWLLRDFYLDLSKTNITPKNYLEDALGPVQSGERDVSSKNAIRESICALFPHRECFTLVRPVNNEKDLQRLDQLPMNKFRPEFTSGLDAFTKFVFDRTRIKQVGASNMTGPILAGLTQSFLDAINTGAVAMISSSCQAPMPLQPLSCRFCGRNPNLRVGSGSTGVRCTVSGRYQAYLKVNGKQKVVGTFDTEDAAVNARFRELEKLTAKTKRSKAHNKALKTKTKCFKAQDKTLSSGGSSSQQAIERADLNEELSKKTHEYEGCIKNLQTNLTQVEDEYKKKLTEVEDEYKKKLWKETLAKRELYNIIQTLKGSIRVFCRSRPLTEKEILSGSKCAIDFNRADDGCIGIMDGGTKKTFEFDRVYKVNDNQAEVYADASPLITSVMDGYNVCIFAYGQTGAGKTFTMLGTEWDRGLNYRAVEELFKIVEERKNTVTYDISFSLLEVYNEQIRDLLATSPSSKWFEVKETGDGSHHVPGIIETNVKDVHQAWNILQSGSKSRVVEANNVNQDSSRSHWLLIISHFYQNVLYFGMEVVCFNLSNVFSVICIMVRAKNLINGKYTRSKLSLIDLAGSERLSKTQAEGERLKEAQYINLSLSALGRVIAAITSRAEHIPYRNSKLTQILQDSLGGDSKVLMFVNISPSDCEVAESLSSLKFARDVKRVELGLAKKHLDTTKIHQNVKLMENYQPKRKETCTAAKVAKIPLRQATLASATAAHKMAASSKKAKLFSPLANMRI